MSKLETYIEVHSNGKTLFATLIQDVTDQRGMAMPFAVSPFAIEENTRTIVRNVRLAGYVSYILAPEQCDKVVLAALQKQQDALEAAMLRQKLAQKPTPEEEKRMESAEKRILVK